MNTEEMVRKLKKKVEILIPLLNGDDSLKIASIHFEDGIDSDIFMNRIVKTNQKYPNNRCLFIACYESGSLRLDFKVRESESTLVIRKNDKIIYNRVETDLGISPAEIALISMILHVKYFVSQHKRIDQLKTNIAGNNSTQFYTIS